MNEKTPERAQLFRGLPNPPQNLCFWRSKSFGVRTHLTVRNKDPIILSNRSLGCYTTGLKSVRSMRTFSRVKSQVGKNLRSFAFSFLRFRSRVFSASFWSRARFCRSNSRIMTTFFGSIFITPRYHIPIQLIRQ